jgi:hypothetical protein
MRPAFGLLTLGTLATCGGCLMIGGGLSESEQVVADGSAPAVDAPAALLDAGGPPDQAIPKMIGPPDPIVPLHGTPPLMGCADGSREGFLDAEFSPNIAGCSGAWRLPGLKAPWAVTPQCGRQAGNEGLIPGGEGCGVADLCAEGWHVCVNAAEVQRVSASQCESAAAANTAVFFLVLAGASPQGACYPDDAATNDLHGCGSLGRLESLDCDPLDRRLGFAECQATAGVWSCGGAQDFLQEAALVVKTDPSLGGVLCCRTP